MNTKKILDLVNSLTHPRQVEVTLSPKTFRDRDAYSFHETKECFQIEASSARGALYAAYDILEGKKRGGGEPEFTIRGLYPCESLPRQEKAQLVSYIDRMGRWKMNNLVAHTRYGWREHGRTVEEECEKRGIEITLVVYWDFLKHLTPEHFAKDEHSVPWTAGIECETRICPSNPNALERFRLGVREYFENTAHIPYRRLLTTGDGFRVCRCAKCKNLSPIDQWMPTYDIFMEEGERIAPHIEKDAYIYVQRYSVPENLDARSLARVMFDDHQRNRRVPLGRPHDYSIPHREDQVDPRAAGAPNNVYLFDRLKEWRSFFDREIYVFENLMLQSTFSCPLENTSVYLEDLKSLKSVGVNGAVYEAFEPGIESFIPLFEVISRAMWDLSAEYTPSQAEVAFVSDKAPDVLRFFEFDDFDWEKYECDDVVATHLLNVRDFWRDYEPGATRKLLDHVLAHRERFDWLYIGFSALKLCHRSHSTNNLNEEEHRFLSTTKLWDYMEQQKYPREKTGKLIESIVHKMSEY